MLKRFAMAAALIGAWSGVVFAGSKSIYPVAVDVVHRDALGSLGSARNSSDTVQYIGCEVYSGTGSGNTTGYCYAKDAAAHYLTCRTTDSSLLATIRAMSGDCLLYFEADTSGLCTAVDVTHHSIYEPKQP